jgi:hypothetical protein
MCVDMVIEQRVLMLKASQFVIQPITLEQHPYHQHGADEGEDGQTSLTSGCHGVVRMLFMW